MTSCSVDTASLDGESNLKKFNAVSPDIAQLVQEERRVSGLSIGCELQPNMKDLDKFSGKLTSATYQAPNGAPATDIDVSVPPEGFDIKASTKGNAQVLLRECKLRACSHIIGLAVYTGPDTFIKQQSKKTAAKQIFLSQQMNTFVAIMFITQLVLCLIGAIMFFIFASANSDTHLYLGLEDVQPLDAVITFFTFVQVTSGFIPISLYVSMEMARIAQKLFMEQDDDMYYSTPGERNRNIVPRVRNSTLNDQLGQVTHIFSDKTGTLTANSFEFRKMTVGGFQYGVGTTEIAVISARGQARTEADRQNVKQKEIILKRGIENMKRPNKTPHVNFVEDDGERRKLQAVRTAQVRTMDAQGRDMTNEHIQELEEFILSFILCSTVDLEPDAKSGDYALAGDSSDEICFCYAAKELGYKLMVRSYDKDTKLPTVEVEKVDPQTGQKVYIRRLIASLNPYSSARAMMSIVMMDPDKDEDAPDRVTIYAKGSDQKVLAKLYQLPSDQALRGMDDRQRSFHERQRAMRDRTADHCKQFAVDGLRTLVFGYRRMSYDEFAQWFEERDAASKEADRVFKEMLERTSDESAAKKAKKNIINQAINKIEKDLVYAGAVGYEDTLQEDVPNTISRLSDAGISVFMLTGDKEGTAINIGYGVQMLTSETEMQKLTWEWRYGKLFGDDDDEAGNRDPLRFERALLREVDKALSRGQAFVDADANPLRRSSRSSSYGGGPKMRSARGVGGAAAAASGGDAPSPHSALSRKVAADDKASSQSPTADLEEGGVTPGNHRSPNPLAELDSVRRDSAAVSPMSNPASGLGRSPLPYGKVRETQLTKLRDVLVPTRGEDGRVSKSVLSAAQSVVKGLYREIKEVDQRVRAAKTEKNKEKAAQEKRDVVEWVLAFDLVMLLVKYAGGNSRPLALVVDEGSMSFFLDWPGYEEIEADTAKYPNGVMSKNLDFKRDRRAAFLEMLQRCTSVIGARCQPSQKRTVLELVKYEVPNSCCLGIGDGANDVEMISAAHVGVGIEGLEGNSAANASDYSFGQFRFLQKLLLVHGRWNYMRMAILILVVFYKNSLFTLVQYWYNIYTGWSGQKVFPEFATQAYNMTFTGVAIIAVGAMDQDVDQDSAQRFPALYSSGRLRKHFNSYVAVRWLFQSVYESLLIFFLCVLAMGESAQPDGYTASIFGFGSVLMSIVVCVVNIRIAIETYQHEIIFVCFTFLSTASWPAVAYLIDYFDSEGSKGIMSKVFGSAAFWFTVPMVVFLSLIPTLLVKFVQSVLLPTYAMVVRESEFFIRNGQQDETFAPQVESEDTIRRRRTGETVDEYRRRLVKSNIRFDRSDLFTKAFVSGGTMRADDVDATWAEQEAALVLHPIESQMQEKLAQEERTRLQYPYHFYYSLLVRKRILNLVQQGRLTRDAVGLRKLADDDIVMGSIDEVEKQGEGDEVVQRFSAGSNMNLAVQQTGDENHGERQADLSAGDTRRFLRTRFQRVARMAAGGAASGGAAASSGGMALSASGTRGGQDRTASIASASQVKPSTDGK